MDFFRKVVGGKPQAGSKNQSDPNAMWLYVQCSRCGAPVAIRIDTRNDISTDYETGGRYLRKEIMDSTCFQLMYATVRFDSSGKIAEKEVEHGKFLTAEEFKAANNEFQAKHGHGGKS